jgi:nickel-type superoxide dismutase maturation protease
MLRLVKVTGESLSPEYQEGDFVLIAKIPFFFDHFHRGDVVVFRHPQYGTMIKQVEEIFPERDEIYVVGTHENSVDSRSFGAISQKLILGKVIWHLQKPTHSLPSRREGP